MTEDDHISFSCPSNCHKHYIIQVCYTSWTSKENQCWKPHNGFLLLMFRNFAYRIWERKKEIRINSVLGASFIDKDEKPLSFHRETCDSRVTEINQHQFCHKENFNQSSCRLNTKYWLAENHLDLLFARSQQTLFHGRFKFSVRIIVTQYSW